MRLHVHLRAVFGLTLLLATACSQPAQPAATTAPQAAPTSAPAPTKPAAAASASPAAAPASSPAAPSSSPSAAAAPKPAASAAPAASGPAVSITGPVADEAKALNAAGATFPAPLYQKWFDEYAKLT